MISRLCVRFTQQMATLKIKTGGTYRSVGSASTNFITVGVPAHFEDASGASVTMDQISGLEMDRTDRVNRALSSAKLLNHRMKRSCFFARRLLGEIVKMRKD